MLNTQNLLNRDETIFNRWFERILQKLTLSYFLGF